MSGVPHRSDFWLLCTSVSSVVERAVSNQPDLGPPPRTVPLSVRACLLFGGGLNLAAWIVILVGMIFFWVFVANCDLPSRYYFRGELATAKGRVTHSERTSFTEGGSRNSSGARVFAIHYRFTDARGEEHTDVSYARGRKTKAGKKVTIQFPKGNPEISRIKGMRRGMLSPWAALAGIFPLVGLILAAVGLRKGLRAGALLADGQMGLGTLKSKKPTATRVNRRTVYKLTFEFQAGDGRTYEAVARSHTPEALEDDAQERLLYDPYAPARAVMFDSLPGKPVIADSGRISEVEPMRMAWTLLLPALAIVCHGGYALYLLGR